MKVMENAVAQENMLGGYQTFIKRYEKGAPWEGYSDQEVLDRYRELEPRLTADEFERAAHTALDRFSPQNRILFGQYLYQAAGDQGVRVPDLEADDTMSAWGDSRVLAHVLTDLWQYQPNSLTGLLGRRGAILDSLLMKAVLAGIVAEGARNFLADHM